MTTSHVLAGPTADKITVVSTAAHSARPGLPRFETLYQDRFGEMTRLAYLLVGDHELAQDIAQDAFVGLHRHLHRVEEPVAYLRKSIANGAASHHRRLARARRQPIERAVVVELGADELMDALATLPSRQRSALVLRFHLDLSEQQIADTLGVRPGTVGSLIHRGLASLKVVLT